MIVFWFIVDLNQVFTTFKFKVKVCWLIDGSGSSLVDQ